MNNVMDIYADLFVVAMTTVAPGKSAQMLCVLLDVEIIRNACRIKLALIGNAPVLAILPPHVE